ncbi:MAG: response regulator [Elusimicrobia bacterium]|nr:response regulator [Elusimicrobiota bacterium]
MTKPKRVLIVDDEHATNALASEYLRLAGFEVASCYDAESALKALEADSAFDAVVLDKRLPGMDGFEAGRRIKADPRTAGIPILALSASFHPQQEPSPAFDAFLGKPFSPRDLLVALNKITQRS